MLRGQVLRSALRGHREDQCTCGGGLRACDMLPVLQILAGVRNVMSNSTAGGRSPLACSLVSRRRGSMTTLWKLCVAGIKAGPALAASS